MMDLVIENQKKFIRLGSKLNALIRAYISRVTGDSGTVDKTLVVRQAYAKLPAQDSIEFAWLGGAGSKKRTSGIYNFFTKLYSLFGTNDATQTTEADQPYVSGNIAPNEVECLKNPNGDTRYLTHPEINFASDEEWSVTNVFYYDGQPAANYSNLFGSIKTSFRFGPNIAYAFTFITESVASIVFRSLIDVLKFIGNTNVLSLIADGEGNISLYINNSLIATKSGTNTDAIFNSLLRARGSVFNGAASAHIIRSKALTPAQVSAEHALLREIYPEIPSVVIGTDDIATSNLEVVASSNGTVITEAADNADWATGASRWCYHNDDSAVGAIYGKLYNKAARDVIIANPPSGWHVATEAELTAMVAYGGNALKIPGTDYWNTTGGTNTTGFSAIGGSSRNADGTFNTIKNTATFWCADSDKVMTINHDSDTATVAAVTSVNDGHSIRLIKD